MNTELSGLETVHNKNLADIADVLTRELAAAQEVEASRVASQESKYSGLNLGTTEKYLESNKQLLQLHMNRDILGSAFGGGLQKQLQAQNQYDDAMSESEQRREEINNKTRQDEEELAEHFSGTILQDKLDALHNATKAEIDKINFQEYKAKLVLDVEIKKDQIDRYKDTMSMLWNFDVIKNSQYIAGATQMFNVLGSMAGSNLMPKAIGPSASTMQLMGGNAALTSSGMKPLDVNVKVNVVGQINNDGNMELFVKNIASDAANSVINGYNVQLGVN
jgi:hypothetical protein